eukprot:TRINITY_DN3614_c0_g1_i1.p1 TRINITY_DN3614_c0_g1~~TRINITY_DN3614_c0_g1_i1.p1  ORF type:complete len:154 (-),score=6.78 TRINITY_DN3614_c0_g1_i1:85-546(-)
MGNRLDSLLVKLVGLSNYMESCPFNTPKTGEGSCEASPTRRSNWNSRKIVGTFSDALEERVIKFLESKGVFYVETSPQRSTKRKIKVATYDDDICTRTTNPVLEDHHRALTPMNNTLALKTKNMETSSIFKRRMGGTCIKVVTHLETPEEKHF